MSNEKNLTPEMLEQASKAPSAEALLTLAQENGITLTAEEAATYYAQFHPEIGAISDEELDNVSGGGGLCGNNPPPERCEVCGCTNFHSERAGYYYVWKCNNCHPAVT